ncbi:hypothetical protein NDU88_008318 [Pleurodeles waltl]|uniref:Uncharacterized protein n=1 Tax=Pleurodeles waltl TaxID=8319 RepID=A0AAV7QPJ6_PLEWA|nr:hypothetical protein NDU88_008318 [Pleurodeles waltl]
MTYDAEGVIKRKREDGRQERSEEKEEPRTRKSRGEETTTIQEPEEERENTGAGEQSTKREPTFTQELKGEEDTASNVIETEGETRKAGRLEDRRNQWATPNPTEEKSGDHLLAGRAPGGTWPSQCVVHLGVPLPCPRFVVLLGPLFPQLHLPRWDPCQGRGPKPGPPTARTRSSSRRMRHWVSALFPGLPVRCTPPDRGPPVSLASPHSGGGIGTEAHEFLCASAGPLMGCRSGPGLPAGAPPRLPPPLTSSFIPGSAQAPITLSAPRSPLVVSRQSGLSSFRLCSEFVITSLQGRHFILPLCFSSGAVEPPGDSWIFYGFRFFSAQGVPLFATGLSWPSSGSGSQDYCAKIGGRWELCFTRAAPSASIHTPINKQTIAASDIRRYVVTLTIEPYSLLKPVNLHFVQYNQVQRTVDNETYQQPQFSLAILVSEYHCHPLLDLKY